MTTKALKLPSMQRIKDIFIDTSINLRISELIILVFEDCRVHGFVIKYNSMSIFIHDK